MDDEVGIIGRGRFAFILFWFLKKLGLFYCHFNLEYSTTFIFNVNIIMALFITILYILLIDTLVKLNLCETIYLFFRNFKVAPYTVRIKKNMDLFQLLQCNTSIQKRMFIYN